jgi:hypothetical protein
MKRRDVETAWVRPVGRLPQMALPSLRPPPDGSGYCGKGTAEKAECNIAGRVVPIFIDRGAPFTPMHSATAGLAPSVAYLPPPAPGDIPTLASLQRQSKLPDQVEARR